VIHSLDLRQISIAVQMSHTTTNLETLHRLQSEWLIQKSQVGGRRSDQSGELSLVASSAAKEEERETRVGKISTEEVLPRQQAIQDDSEYEEVEIQRAANIIQPKVKQWLEYHSEIEVLQKAIKERKEKKKELDLAITTFMLSHEIPHFDLREKQLVLNVTQRQKPLSKSFISDVLSRTCSSEQMQKVTNMLFKERPTVEKTSLKYKKSKQVKI